MRKNLQRRSQYYQQAFGIDQGTFLHAMTAIRGEELMLAVERDVLLNEFEVAP